MKIKRIKAKYYLAIRYNDTFFLKPMPIMAKFLKTLYKKNPKMARLFTKEVDIK